MKTAAATFDPQQQQVWRDFYEQSWAARATFIRSLIDAGESNAYRLIKQFEAHERKFELHREDGSAQYRRRYEDHALDKGPGRLPPFRATSIRGQDLMVPFHARDNLHNFIIDYMGDADPYDCIVELGCGYGRNLFEIFYCGGPAKIPYFGGELTESGVSLARELAALEPNIKTTFFRFDYLKPDVSAVPKVDRALVYTIHSIEQVQRIDPELFRAIASIGRHVTCIHLEPFGFQIADLGPATKAHAKFARDAGWNQNFIEALFAARDRFWLGVQVLATEMFLPLDRHNPTSLAIWESPWRN
jgi:SAM-dependent methyltransferase